MAFEIANLRPQAGAWARPIADAVRWLGGTIAFPFGNYLSSLLLIGLLVHLAARWLGGRAGIAQLLGVTALSAAPELFLSPLQSLISMGAAMAGAPGLTSINGLLRFISFLWGLAIYIKAAALTEEFTIGRAIGAVALMVVLLVAIVLVAGIAVVIGAVIFGSIIGAMAGTTR